MISPAIQTAFVGLNRNMHQMSNAAAQIANPDSFAGVDEIVDLKRAAQGAKVNAAVIRTANETTGILIDLIA
jgi:hypothetical protein